MVAIAVEHLRIQGLSAGYGGKTVLNDVSMMPRDIFGILGPSGAGKSTLLRVICGDDGKIPEFWYEGRVTRPSERPVELLDQKARLYTGTVFEFLNAGHHANDSSAHWDRIRRLMEDAGVTGLIPDPRQSVGELSLAQHKMLMIGDLLGSSPTCLLLDEPLAGVALSEEAAMLQFIGSLRQHTDVVFVTHNKQHARAVCDEICLVTGGRIAEITPAKMFFESPRSPIGREFLRYGSAWPGSPTTKSVPPGRNAPPPGTNDFRWVLSGSLGGMAQPGLYGDLQRDMRWLQYLDIRHIVNLTEGPAANDELRAAGFTVTHFPIVDMGIPDLAATADVCATLNADMDAGNALAVHCRAGQGRTGTLLASLLVYRGLQPLKAIEQVRRSNPRCIETPEQARFVYDFAGSW